MNDGQTQDSLMPVNYVMLAVISGIIGLVLAGFTGWHILLASRGQTTIECLEKTRYLSPLRVSMQRQHFPVDPGQERVNDEPMSHGEQRHPTYDAMQRARARARYEEYLDEQDSAKLPSAFDLGRRRNFAHLFGPKKLLWIFPICNTTGDGWTWEPSPKWLEARAKIAREREEQANRERSAGWGESPEPEFPIAQSEGAGRHYVSYPKNNSFNNTPSKADRILGRSPNEYADSSVSMSTLTPRGQEQEEYELSSDEEPPSERRNLVSQRPLSNWPQQVQRVGIVTNTLLGNTLARQKDDSKGWDGTDDDGVD